MSSGYISLQTFTSPFGELLVGSYNDKLCICSWTQHSEQHATILHRVQKTLNAECSYQTSKTTHEFCLQMNQYFQNKRQQFTIPYITTGTRFQQEVWEEVCNVPYGSTVSYSEIAKRIQHPTAIRAVASAIGLNAIVLLIPCHRIIGKNNTLIGYSGNLPCKKRLLELERNDRLPFID